MSEYDQLVTELGRRILEAVDAAQPSTTTVLLTFRDVTAYLLGQVLCPSCQEHWVEEFREALRAQNAINSEQKFTCH